MGRKVAFLGLPNIAAQAYCTVSTPATTGGFVPADMPAANLQTEEPSELTRITTLDPIKTQWHFAFTKVSSRDLNSAALVNVNLQREGRYRFIGLKVSESWAYVDTAPNAIADSDNITGVVGNVDEETSSPDANYISPTTTTSNWLVDLDFATPSSSPRPGAGRAMWVIRAQLVGSPTVYYPRLLVTGIRSGEPEEILNAEGQPFSRAVSEAGTGGQVLIFPFDPSDINYAANGSDIRVRIEGYPGSDGSYCRLVSVRLLTETNTVAHSYDSNWIDSPVDNYAEEDGAPPTRSVAYFSLTDWTDVQTVLVLVADDQATKDPEYETGASAVPLTNVTLPSGYVQAGVAPIGAAIFLSRGQRFGSGPTLRVITEQSAGTTEAGQTYGADAFSRRAMGLELIATRAEMLALMDRLAWRRGRSGAFFVASEPDLAAQYQLFGAFWSTLAGEMEVQPMPVKYQTDDTMLYSLRLQLEEKL